MKNHSVSHTNISDALANLKPGKLPLDIFNQVARLTVTPVIELVPFYRDKNGNIKVFLLQRKPDDLRWANMYHIPGTVLLATDEIGSFSDAYERILVTMLNGLEHTEFVFIDARLLKVSRGTEVAILYSTELTQSPDKKYLFDPKNLPNSIIEGQSEMIVMALNSFTKINFL